MIRFDLIFGVICNSNKCGFWKKKTNRQIQLDEYVEVVKKMRVYFCKTKISKWK